MTLIDLPDGRKLDIDLAGPEDGVPLLFHHGTPGSKVASRGLQRSATDAGLRLVTWSRPGYGDSTRRPDRSVADVADDAAAVLDHLGAARCVVAGKSGGGPHALATAALLPDRVAAVCSIAGVAAYGMSDLDFLAGMGESNIEEFGLALDGADALRPWLENEAAQMDGVTPEQLTEVMSSLLPEVDRAVLTGEYGEDTVASFTEGLRTGVDGWLDDDLAFTRPWGFALDEIAVPTYVWQGDADLMVPFAHGKWLADRMPGSVAHLEPDQGHLSITVGALNRMLAELVSHL